MSCINISLCIVKTESTQTEGVEIRLIKERITAGITKADKAVGEKWAQAFRETPLGQWVARLGCSWWVKTPTSSCSEGTRRCGGLNWESCCCKRWGRILPPGAGAGICSSQRLRCSHRCVPGAPTSPIRRRGSSRLKLLLRAITLSTAVLSPRGSFSEH